MPIEHNIHSFKTNTYKHNTSVVVKTITVEQCHQH